MKPVIHISKGNSKMKKIPNISLIPGETCSPDCANTCYHQGCYAKKFFKLYPSCRNSWTDNTFLAMNEPKKYFSDIQDFLAKNSPEFFRWHVSGDIPSMEYFDGMIMVARAFPAIKFLAFTKRFDLLCGYDLETVPDNLKVVFSRWPGDNIPPSFSHYPSAWLASDDRRPATASPCSGRCDKCAACWELRNGDSVFFEKH